jgi:hypothetical protein
MVQEYRELKEMEKAKEKERMEPTNNPNNNKRGVS